MDLKLLGARRINLNVKKVMSSAAYLVVLLGAMSFVSSSVVQTSTPVGIITSGSMEPILNVGDIVFIQPSKVEDVRVGDIIAFYATGKTVVVHRVVQTLEYPTRVYLITKGDANDVRDQAVGMGPVTEKNLLGKTLCIEGLPIKIPYIGRIWAELYNLSVWITQDKPWSFWAPVLVLLFICWPSRGKGKKIFQKPLLQRKIHKKQILVIAFVGFAAISIFTMWFRAEQYTLGMRIACLRDFEEKMNFNYGSMIYGQVEDNTITVTGAPMFPVKTVSVVLGNASAIASTQPRSAVAEPNKYLDLTLHAEVPPFGSIMPGLYRGEVFVYSSYLWIMLPDEVIFAVYDSSNYPWLSTAILELIGALMVSSLLVCAILIGETVVRQILYTYIWMQRRPEEDQVPNRILRVRTIKAALWRNISSVNLRARSVTAIFDVKGTLRRIEIFLIAGLFAGATYSVTQSFILALVIECIVAAVYSVFSRSRMGGAVVGSVFTHFVMLIFLIIRNSVISARSFTDIWTFSATGFTGAIELVTTIPIVIIASMVIYKVVSSAKVWYLEQETLSWTIIRKAGQFTIPSFEQQLKEIIPKKIGGIQHHILTIKTYRLPRRLEAESCKILRPVNEANITARRIGADEYIQLAKTACGVEEASKEAGKLESTSPYWTSKIRKEPILDSTSKR